MYKKLIIWFIGGNSVGKTTQARVIHDFFSDILDDRSIEIVEWIENNKKIAYTKMNAFSTNVGRLTDRQCSGTDTMGSKFQIFRSFDEAFDASQVVIVEGIMATSKWIELFKAKDAVLWTILLDVSEDVNFMRLRQRRSVKLGIDPSEVQIARKTQENLSSKLRGFRSLYLKAVPHSNYSTSLFTDEMEIVEISIYLRNELKKIIDESY